MIHYIPLQGKKHRYTPTWQSRTLIALTLAGCSLAGGAYAQTTHVPLADQPVFASSEVPGNLALTLSVEWPTVSRIAHVGNYSSDKEFLGYFDPNKCYTYVKDTDTTQVTSPGGSVIEIGKGDRSYFSPAAITSTRKCSVEDQWSGNFLNWASLTAIEPFRWAMTGGRRVVDTVGTTIIEKGWNSGQGLFPERNQNAQTDGSLPVAEIANATPFKQAKILRIGVNGRGYAIRITRSDKWWGADDEKTEDYTIRVKVCDPSVGVESNCVQYSANNWKPEGLVQQYADKMRFSTFGYMNHSGNGRDGGVLRARQKFVGPTFPRPGTTAQTNANAEWSATTGIMARNPDATDATATSSWATLTDDNTIQDSGVMNYLNKFGQIILGSYKGNDPVNELYYAALRYYEGLDNIDAWSALGTTNTNTKRQYLDGFPVIRDWTKEDPIQYACQRNFVLGIGDIYTHADRNVPGGSGDGSPSMPAFNDPIFDAGKSLENLKLLQNYAAGGAGKAEGSNASADYMAGLAFEANTRDIRPDNINKKQTIGKQTVQTYWVDVLEQSFSRNNKFYLAAKFGGLKQSKLPADFNPYTYSGTIPLDWWSTNGDILKDTRNNSTWNRPDNYFTAGSPDLMVSGLKQAFQSIANEIRAYTTSFAYTSPDVQSGSLAYSSQYDSNGWSGAVSARKVTYDSSGKASVSEVWNTDTSLAAQLASNGWDNSRIVTTWKKTANQAVPFRYGQLSNEQKSALNTSYVTGNDAEKYLEYLRGSRENEIGSSSTGSTHSYRNRSTLLGDIVGSKVTPVGPPNSELMDSANPGYSAFKTAHEDRKTVVYVGANDGMLHAFDGSESGTNAGRELFSYIPADMYNLTYAQSSTNEQDGPDSILGNHGNPEYAHRFSVDSTPVAFDVDFNKTSGATGGTSDWHSLLVGGLGKGGRSYYAIDITEPDAWTTETAVAGKVLWEFTDDDMGFTFGTPTAVKTTKHGWVIVVPSGHNNSDGKGYLYLINPRNGQRLEKIATPTAAPGMAYASAYVADFGNGTTDAVYAGDLLGQVWRFDLTAASGNYPAPVKIAQLTNSQGQALPITTPPLIEIHPGTRQRYVLIGTGRLLSIADVESNQEQAFFAIKDGTITEFKEHPTPVTRSALDVITDLSNGVPDANHSVGWVLDLGVTSGIGWRVVTAPVIAHNVIAFTTMLTTGDACSPAGVSRVYVMDFGKAETLLESREDFYESDNSITDMRLLVVDGDIEVVLGDNLGNIETLPTNLGDSTALKLLNWRETFTFD